MQAFWMGVGCWKPSAVMACRGSNHSVNPSRARTTSWSASSFYTLLSETTGVSEATGGRSIPMSSCIDASLTFSSTFSLLLAILVTENHVACAQVFFPFAVS